jgi:hypothetical protein
MARAFIGPDVSTRVRCASTQSVPIASVDATGDGLVSWSVTLRGDPQWQVLTPILSTCAATGPTVANVELMAPAEYPGTTYDAVATVHATNGAFPDGMVTLHGEVAAPTVLVDHPHIDFGDVAPGALVSAPLDFTLRPLDMLDIEHDPLGASAFSADWVAAPIFMSPTPMSRWSITFVSLVPGDYTGSIVWTGTLPSVPSTVCSWTTTTTMHAHVLGDAGATKDDAADGGATDGGATDDGATDDGP